jgi:hypothetical protein
LASESDGDEDLDIRSGAHLRVSLPAQSPKLILIDKATGRVLASTDDQPPASR